MAQFGLIIVGDEILSGKRQDKHFERVRELLSARGLQLSRVTYVGDDRARLTDVLSQSLATDDIVFCCGGIGATPDDHTRQAAAAALGRALRLHPTARERITAQCEEMAREGKGSADMSTAENLQRLKMGEFPEGADVIENPFNRIPGFSIGSHHFVPGFSVMAWPMIESVLDAHYAELAGSQSIVERSLLAYRLPESRVTPVLETIESAFPGVRVFCLPSVGTEGREPHVELGVKGAVPDVEKAFVALREAVAALDVPIQECEPARSAS
ncbi:MAG: molybdopterin-binding protein [Burkholderiaceae bacterium]